ncbi:MAG TPA: hypothetical protein VFE53_08545 [Mucilaginibacter sp.]|jgi:hypothetical protein|nr:hypothetical protein [Mucilaginibacter sp.]
MKYLEKFNKEKYFSDLDDDVRFKYLNEYENSIIEEIEVFEKNLKSEIKEIIIKRLVISAVFLSVYILTVYALPGMNKINLGFCIAYSLFCVLWIIFSVASQVAEYQSFINSDTDDLHLYYHKQYKAANKGDTGLFS